MLDIVVLIVYLAGVMAIGLYFYRKNKSAQSFTTGEGRLPSWALGMSVFATFVSSISFLALPGNAYAKDWNGYVFSLSIPLAAWIAVKYFVPLYRSIKSDSAYYYLEQRFGRWAGIYASACYLLTQLARMGAILYLLALPMHALFGWSIPLIIVFTGIVVLIYASIGGLEAVVWTDAIQGIILIFGALLCLLILIIKIDGGLPSLIHIAADSDKFSLGETRFSFTQSSFWLILVYGLFINLQNFGIDQSYVQRYISARNNRDAAKSVWLGALLYVPVSLLFFFIGTALWVYYQQNVNLLPEQLLAADKADKIFPYFIVNELPAGISGLLIAAIFSAGMSTVSTSINSSATVLLSDYYRKNVSDDRTRLKFLRLASATMGLISILVGLAFNGVASALDTWWALASVFSGGMLGLFLLAFLIRNLKSAEAFFGVLAGVIFIILMSVGPLLGKKIPFAIHANLVIIFGTILIFGTALLIHIFRKK